MKYQIVERAETHLIAIPVIGKPAELGEKVPAAWRELQGRLGEIRGVTDPSRQIGFIRAEDESWEDGSLVTHLGIEVTAPFEPPTGLIAHTLRGGRWVQFAWKGSFLGKDFTNFYPEVFATLDRKKLRTDENAGWIELYDDATHDWSDKANPKNRLLSAFPLREKS